MLRLWLKNRYLQPTTNKKRLEVVCLQSAIRSCVPSSSFCNDFNAAGIKQGKID